MPALIPFTHKFPKKPVPGTKRDKCPPSRVGGRCVTYMRELGADGRSRPARLRVGDPHAVHGSAWCQPSRSTSAKPQPRANAGPAEDVAAADTAAAVAEVPECQIWHAAGEVAGRSTGRGVFADSVRRFVLGGAAAGHGASHHLATQAAMRKLADHWLSPFAAGIREADLTPVLGENRSHCHRRSPSRICPLVKIPPLLAPKLGCVPVRITAQLSFPGDCAGWRDLCACTA